jgi:8-oxo-dGTP pyrophosphatase MutT (NUDIX family)
VGSYEVVSSRMAYEGVFARVRVDEVRMPAGEVKSREVVEQTPAVAAIPLDRDGHVTLLRQYRHAVGARMIEAPAGKLNVDGEAPEEAVRRELAEEAGLAADHWDLLTQFHNSAGWTDEYTLVYLATGLRDADPPGEFTAEAEEADIEILRLPLAEAIGRIGTGDITDAKTVIGLLLANQHVKVQ